LRTSFLALVTVLVAFSGCRTLNPSARNVAILDRAPDKCKNLGTVNTDWSWWGDSTESLNAMRNQTSDMGGNALLLHGDDVGTAYSCPESLQGTNL